MIVEHVGIATTATTWYLVGALIVVWGLTLPVLVRFRAGWSDAAMSLLGLSWLAFGLGILTRFVLLSINAQTFASPSIRLAELPADAVDLAVITAGLFWLTFTAGALIVRLLPAPTLATTLMEQADRLSPGSFVPAIVVTGACVLASQLALVPGPLITPLGLVGSMWVIVATFVWTRHLAGDRRPSWLLAAVFVPGVLRLVVSPYREHIFVMVLVVFASAIFAGRRFRLVAVAPAAFAVAVLGTVGVASYRQVLWGDMSPVEAMERLSLTDVEGAAGSPVMENLQRFHVFDSLLLTVDLVPDVFPFADRNPLVEGVTRGLIPRFLNPDKQQSDEGGRFQTTFWSYYNDPTLEREDATATIAPSMPGSLYEAGGLLYVAGGGFFWAVLLAWIERTREGSRTAAAAGVYVLCAVQALAGLERDYAMATSTLLQTLLVFFLLCAQVWLVDRGHVAALRARTAAPAP